MKKSILLLFTALAVSCTSLVKVSSNTENPTARTFIETVKYTDGDYSTTSVDAFDTLKTAWRKDRPSPIVLKWDGGKTKGRLSLELASDKAFKNVLSVTPIESGADSALVWNLIPEKIYYARLLSDGKAKGKWQIKAEGPLRMIRSENFHNMRDLGGWKTVDGKTLRYGLLYRGGQMNRDGIVASAEDFEVMKDFLGIKADVDLRGFGELSNGTPDDPSDDLYYTPLGEGVEYVNFPLNCYNFAGADSTQWHNAITYLMQHAVDGQPCYFHCIAGADRTGNMAFLLEGVLGVGEENFSKEYELTSFSIYGRRNRNLPGGLGKMVDFIKEHPGETLKDKFESYITVDLGVAPSLVEDFRKAMLE